MCQIELVNMKIYKNNSKSKYTIYKPSCPNASEYKIIIKYKPKTFLSYSNLVSYYFSSILDSLNYFYSLIEALLSSKLISGYF